MQPIAIHEPKNGYRVAILGHRGIPSTYGGFETFAEKITEALVGLGCKVAVYCRKNYFKERPAEYKGARLVYLSTVTNKMLDTFVHTFISVLHVIFKNTADTIIVVNVGNAPFALLAKLFGKKVIFCVDGLDWERKKWGAFAKWYLRTCSYFAKWAAHEVVTDAGSVQEFYLKERGTKSHMIPYGTDIESGNSDPNVLKEIGVESKKYFIYVARFEPENNPLMVVKAHVASGSTLPLVMIGDNRYNQAFVDEIKRAANDKVIFLGYVFGTTYKTLLRESLAYIRAAEVGGISPAVIEAMGRGVCVIANDKPENREPLAESGVFYQLNEASLTEAITTLTAHPEKAIELGKKAAQRAMIVYSWDTIGFEYFKLIKHNMHSVRANNQEIDTLTPANANAGKKKILLTGAGGMLGRAMYEHYARTYNVLATNRTAYESWMRPLDVTNYAEYEKMVAEFKPDYIFHLAAMTNLEECEKHLADAYTLNTLSVKHAAQLSTKYGAKLVYVSTSGVFDGHQTFYTERDEAHPTTVYGLTKQMGALMVEYYATDWLIVRPSWLMGGGAHHDKKFVGKVIEQIVSGKRELFALNDTFGTLTYALDVAITLEKLLARNATGLYNMAGIGRASRYDIAREIVHILGYQREIIVNAVDNTFFKTTYTTPRVASECLVNERLNQESANTMRPWQVALRDYLERDYAHAFNHTTASEHSGLVVKPA